MARLSLDPDEMSDVDDDPVKLTVLASLPAKMTNLEYLVACWKRWPVERNKLGQIKSADQEISKRIESLEYVKRKIIEGIGLQLQEPTLFPQPSAKPLGAIELLPALLQISSLSSSASLQLEAHQVLSLLADISAAYSSPTTSSDLVDVIGIPFLQILIEKLGAKQSSIQALLAGLNGAGVQEGGVLDLTSMDWRNVVRSVNDLTDIKAIANMVNFIAI